MKKSTVLLLFLSVLISSCAGTKYTSQRSGSIQKTTSKLSNSSGLADQIVKTAQKNLGVKYKSGGTTKTGFDCSGLVFTSFKTHDVNLPRTSGEMANRGTKIQTSQARKGDLIFFATDGRKRINHVGIITKADKNEIKFIHASTRLGVIISSTKELYYQKSFVKIMRVL